jgi:hypothetical protein
VEETREPRENLVADSFIRGRKQTTPRKYLGKQF